MPKRFVVFAYLVVALAAASGQQNKKSPSQTEAKASAAATPNGVPAGAVEIETGLWKYTDSKGVLWHYRRTPFGFSKFEPRQELESKAGEDAAKGDLLQATEEGDLVRFERHTPFGVRRWTRKKSELAGEELAAWKRIGEAKSEAKTSETKSKE